MPASDRALANYEMWADLRTGDNMKLGDRFDTPYENGCVVLTVPDDNGMFDAVDSDGVICTYNVATVTRVYHGFI